MATEKQPIPNVINVTIGNNKYEIKAPTVGHLIDIERYKLNMAGGNAKLLALGSESAKMAYLYVECVITMEVLIPQLEKDLSVQRITFLSPAQFKEILRVYVKTVQPWLQSISEAGYLNIDKEITDSDAEVKK